MPDAQPCAGGEAQTWVLFIPPHGKKPSSIVGKDPLGDFSRVRLLPPRDSASGSGRLGPESLTGDPEAGSWGNSVRGMVLGAPCPSLSCVSAAQGCGTLPGAESGALRTSVGWSKVCVKCSPYRRDDEPAGGCLIQGMVPGPSLLLAAPFRLPPQAIQ